MASLPTKPGCLGGLRSTEYMPVIHSIGKWASKVAAVVAPPWGWAGGLRRISDSEVRIVADQAGIRLYKQSEYIFGGRKYSVSVQVSTNVTFSEDDLDG